MDHLDWNLEPLEDDLVQVAAIQRFPGKLLLADGGIIDHELNLGGCYPIMLCSSSHLLNLGPQATPNCEDGGSGGVVSVLRVRK